MDVSTLEGPALDAAVGRIEGVERWRPPEYSKIWTVAGPIIEQHRISLAPSPPEAGEPHWFAAMKGCGWVRGRTPLEAAMRAYVAAKGGASCGRILSDGKPCGLTPPCPDCGRACHG